MPSGKGKSFTSAVARGTDAAVAKGAELGFRAERLVEEEVVKRWDKSYNAAKEKTKEKTAEMKEKMAQQYQKLRQKGPQWAKELVMTDWVTLALLAPIISGLVVYMVYLAQAQHDFENILEILQASGGLTRLITAYDIFLYVTLPLTVIILVYAVGLMILEFWLRMGGPRQGNGIGGPVSKRRYWLYRIGLLVLMAVEYLGLVWLIVCTAATAILLVAAFAAKATTDTASTAFNNALDTWRGATEDLQIMEDLQRELVRLNETDFTIGNVTYNVGEVANTVMVAAFNLTIRDALANSSIAKTIQLAVERVCPEFCINLSFLDKLLNLDTAVQCICEPDAINEIGAIAQQSKGKLYAALIGIVLMILSWIVLLMRLAGRHDTLCLKYRLQRWLAMAGFMSYSELGSGGTTPSHRGDSLTDIQELEGAGPSEVSGYGGKLLGPGPSGGSAGMTAGVTANAGVGVGGDLEAPPPPAGVLLIGRG